MLNEFKKFIMRGNVLDMAVGIVIGSAFTAIISSLVADILMPPIGLLLGNVDFSNLMIVLKEGTTAGPYASLADAQTAGAVTINYGQFLNAVIGFLIIALAVFLLIRFANRVVEQFQSEKEEAVEPTSKDCPYCCTTIPVQARRCPHCTSDLS